MKRQLIFYWVFGATLWLPIFGSAKGATNSISLEALVSEALEHNPELQFYRAELDAAKGERRQAGLIPNPELSTVIGHKSVRGGGMAAEGVAWSVSIMQPFEWPGRIGLRKAIANRDMELAELGFQRFRHSLTNRIHLLGFQLFAAQEKALAVEVVAKRFGSLREVLLQRDPAGLTPLLETRIIEATELITQKRASEASIESQTALLELNHLRGKDPTAPLEIKNPQIGFVLLATNVDFLQAARTNSFDLRVRAVELAQQGFKVALAKSDGYPSLAIGPHYSEERAGERERIIGVEISMPLPIWNKNGGTVQTAKARQLQAEVSYAVAQRDLGRQVAQALASYQAKVREMAKWRPDSVGHFKQAAELADRHYRLGAVPITTYVELQEKYLEALEALLDTKKEALDALQNLQLLTGLMVHPVETKPKTEHP